MKKDYGVFFTVPMVIAFAGIVAIGLPILLMGMTAVITIWKAMAAPVSSGGFSPVMLVAGGILIIFLMRRR